MKTGACFVLAGIAFCLIAADKAPGKPAVPPAKDAPRPKAERDFDHEVLSAVLADLLHDGDDSPLAAQGKPPKEILFAADESKYVPTVEAILVHYRKDRWKKLTEAQLRDAQSATTMLIHRVRDKETIAKFQPDDKRVRIYSKPEKPDLAAIRFEQPVKAFPPGYSPDRRFAVVFLHIPWSIHHATGTYLMSESDGKWTVCLRDFVIYP